MSDQDNGGPAFPSDTFYGEIHVGQRPGMSLRDYLAAHAPQMPPALNEIAKRAEKQDGRDTSDYGAYARLLADWRWAYADAMLKARSA